MTDINTNTVNAALRRSIAQEARLMTDEAKYYRWAKWHFTGGHETVNHSKEEYVRGDVTVNSCEGYFSIFKRGMKGVYQHCQEKHLHRYLAEFDFRYNHRIAKGVNDVARATLALKGAQGKPFHRPLSTGKNRHVKTKQTASQLFEDAAATLHNAP
jgi:hypothetical protein